MKYPWSQASMTVRPSDGFIIRDSLFLIPQSMLLSSASRVRRIYALRSRGVGRGQDRLIPRAGINRSRGPLVQLSISNTESKRDYGKPTLKLSSFFDGIHDAGEDGIPNFRWYVNGKWNAAPVGQTQEVNTPIDGSTIARIHRGTESDVESAIDAASSSQRKIRNLAAIER